MFAKAKTFVNTSIKTLIEGNANLQVEAALHGLTQRKGSAGRVVEWLLTGKSGDNHPTPDLGEIDVKAVIVAPAVLGSKYPVPGLPGHRFKENLRLTSLHYEEIQTQTLLTSPVWCKRKNLVVLMAHGTSKSIEDLVCVSVGMLDLTPHEAAMARDFDYFKAMCAAGQAHTLRSSQNQPTEILKLYSSGNGDNIRQYTDATGNVCHARGKAFYIFKEQLSLLYVPL